MATSASATPSLAKESSQDISKDPPNSYRVKTITYGTKVISICMQNENGPCPLLAICNALLLRGDMFIHPDQSFVTLDELLNQLSGAIMSRKPDTFTNDGERRNYEANIAATMATFGELSRGLDVNVRFSGVFAFEFTVQCGIFDLVGVPLCHGWLPDPQDVAFSTIQNSSYNHLVEKIVAANTAVDKLNEMQAMAESSSSAPSASSENVFSSSPASQTRAAEAEAVYLKAIKEGKIINKWLDDTASQLTFHGITKLHEQIKESQICVFFRNNHFSTILMHEAALWMLVTDQGYTRQQGIVWEKLDSTHGDSVFATSSFDEWRGESSYAALPDLDALKIQQDSSLYGYGSEDSTNLDEQLARQLQEKEDRIAAKAAMTQSQNANTQQRPSNPRGRPLNQSAPAGRQGEKRGNGAAPRPRHGELPRQQEKEDDECTIL